MKRQGETCRKLRRFCAGFTLVEMSVVLIIIGLLILTVFPAITAVRMSGQRAATQTNLQTLLLATAAYVQANGCVPCPTPASTAGSGFGRVRGDTATASCSGCATLEGIPPFVSLGLSSNVAHDGWGHWITMRVDPALTVAALGTVVPPTALCTAADVAASTPTCTLLNASQKGLCQTKLSAANRVSVSVPSGAAQQAAVLFVSHGSKGFGAFKASALPYETGFQSGCRLNFPDATAACVQSLACAPNGTGEAYAKCNATGSNSFVNASMQDGYDDAMAFADRNMLVSMLGNAACQTAW